MTYSKDRSSPELCWRTKGHSTELIYDPGQAKKNKIPKNLSTLAKQHVCPLSFFLQSKPVPYPFNLADALFKYKSDSASISSQTLITMAIYNQILAIGDVDLGALLVTSEV